MDQPKFDQDQYRQLSRKQWEQTAAGWHKWMTLLAQWSDPLTAQMFELAGITTGSHVLDVASGDGSHSIKAAKRVGESGYVLATDMAENMVAYTVEAAREANLTHRWKLVSWTVKIWHWITNPSMR